MPWCRQSAAVAAPASCSFRMPTICSCVNRLPRMLSSSGRCPNLEDSHYLWTSLRGAGQRHSAMPYGDDARLASLIKQEAGHFCTSFVEASTAQTARHVQLAVAGRHTTGGDGGIRTPVQN